MFSEDLCQPHGKSRKGDHNLPLLMDVTIYMVINSQGKIVLTCLFVYLIIAVLGLEPRAMCMLGQLQPPAKIIYLANNLTVELEPGEAKEITSV